MPFGVASLTCSTCCVHCGVANKQKGTRTSTSLFYGYVVESNDRVTGRKGIDQLKHFDLKETNAFKRRHHYYQRKLSLHFLSQDPEGYTRSCTLRRRLQCLSHAMEVVDLFTDRNSRKLNGNSCLMSTQTIADTQPSLQHTLWHVTDGWGRKVAPFTSTTGSI